MPIRPENAARYPKNWRTELVPAARARSGDRCECAGQCGLSHAAADEINAEPARCRAVNGQPHPTTGSKVVLTLAHMHGEPLESQDIGRMFHACQQCHNRYDAPERRKGIKARARAKRAAGDLF